MRQEFEHLACHQKSGTNFAVDASICQQRTYANAKDLHLLCHAENKGLMAESLARCLLPIVKVL